MTQAESGARDVLVWRANPMQRMIAYGGAVVLVILAWRLVAAFGFAATIAALFAAGVCFFLWWGLLRPKLTAGPDGVDVVLGAKPVHVVWRDIRRVEAGSSGVKITISGGSEVTSRWPQRDRGAKPGDVTEADRVASYLVRRAEWARRPSGPEPTYEPVPLEPRANGPKTRRPRAR